MSKRKIDIKKSTKNLNASEIKEGMKEVEIVPKTRNVVCVILRESKNAILRYIPFGEENDFSVKGNTYFLISDGIFLTGNNVLMAVYLEGISTPLTHKNIKKKTVDRSYIDAEGKIQNMKVEVIDGLKYDSKIIDVITNRKLAHRFLHVKPDMTMYVVAIMLVIVMIISAISAVFAFKGA